MISHRQRQAWRDKDRQTSGQPSLQRRLELTKAIYSRLEQRIMALPKHSDEREQLIQKFESIALERRRLEGEMLGHEQR